jgi:hypothetical protein
MGEAGRAGQQLWEDFLRTFGQQFGGGKVSAIAEALPLLQESAIAFDAGTYGVTALGCRASIESALYLFLTRRPGLFGWRTESPKFLDGGLREVYIDELIRGAAAIGGLTADLKLQAIRIRDDGNFTAHTASKKDKEKQKAIASSIKVILKTGSIPKTNLRTGVSKAEAWADLESTSRIILALAEAHPKLPALGPDPADHGQD